MDFQLDITDWVWCMYPERKTQVPELLKRIKPLVRNDDGLYIVDPSDPFDQSFIWDPVYVKEVKWVYPLTSITTYHTWGHYSLFKPSAAEVIARIPEEFLSFVRGFEILEMPDLKTQWTIVEAGYHKATTALYGTVVPHNMVSRLQRWLKKTFQTQ